MANRPIISTEDVEEVQRALDYLARVVIKEEYGESVRREALKDLTRVQAVDQLQHIIASAEVSSWVHQEATRSLAEVGSSDEEVELSVVWDRVVIHSPGDPFIDAQKEKRSD